MKSQIIYRSRWMSYLTILLLLVITGCAGQGVAPTSPPAEPTSTAEPSSPTKDPSSTTPSVEPTVDSKPTADSNVLFQDTFTNPGTGWASAEFDNYFIGYHEPEYYHVEIKSPHLRAPVVGIPNAETNNFPDATIELQVYTVSGRTATDGDYRYGLVFRRTGDNYYAFTISPITKTWEVFKSSPSGIVNLTQGTDEGIQGLDVADLLRVDAQGSNFFFSINNQPVGELTDVDYAAGTVGLYAENIENTNTHVHFDALTIKNVEAPPQEDVGALLYEDAFTNPGTGWAAAEFDNYFIGYHEPEYYHVEIKSPFLKAPVVSIPNSETNNFPDATIELQVYTVSGRTATDGDYRYGLAFRRSGDNFYAFTISPTTKTWEVFKSSPSGIVTLSQGTDEGIQGLDVDDLLRVDAQGSSFLFSINNQLVGQITDTDYPEGSVGLYAENLENTNTHVHFDGLTIRDVTFALSCSILEGGTVNVRNGPGTTFAQIGILSSGDSVKAFGKSANQWIQIELEGSAEPGWVSYSEGYMSCTPSVDMFPVVSP
ncbi:MAG TPA: SH3 domain-containing protein [Anaerolineales bacterium]|nr:SH3 domain-containing protein [Anaerolineales bacterium]